MASAFFYLPHSSCGGFLISERLSFKQSDAYNRGVRTYGLPDKYTERIEAGLKATGYSLSQPRKLAQAILQLSDHYQKDNSVSPWEFDWAQAAYLSYFFPLNYARVTAVVNEGHQRGIFTDLKKLIDYGSGTGAATLATNDVLKHEWQEQLCYEPFQQALNCQSQLAQADYLLKTTSSEPKLIEPNTLALFSYSLNELKKFPQQFLNCDALMLIEPSTRELGRKLLQLRDDLIANHGFYAYAPCPHQGLCPLLNDSDRDWCHDRIAWQAPDWFTAIENELPIKNHTLTYSYVLLKKTPPPLHPSTDLAVRVVGDPLLEKGKTRQLICLDSQRRFLSWLPQRLKREDLKHFNFNRGDLISLTRDLEERANELRVKSPQQITKII